MSVRPLELIVPLLTLVLSASAPGAEVEAPATDVPAAMKTFLNRYCIDCHGSKKQKGDFRVDTMLRVSRSAEDAEYWQLVRDNLTLGDMPPERAKQPKLAEVETVVAWVEGELRRARRMLGGHADEVVLRRLNRTEFEFTIADLFDVRGDFADGFPDDAEADGFDNNGAALMLSAAQFEAYMKAIDFVLDRAIETGKRPATKKADTTLHAFNAEAWKRHRDGIERRKQRFDKLTPQEKKRTEEMIQTLKENPHVGFKYPVLDNGVVRAPTPKDGPGVDGLIATRYRGDAADTGDMMRVREPGWYRFRVTAYAVKNDGEPVRMRVQYGSFRQGTIPQTAAIEQLTAATPKTFEYDLYLQPHNRVRVELLDGQRWARSEDKPDLPGPFLAIRSMEMQGPLFEQWPPKGHRALLGAREVDTLSDDQMPAVLAELAPRLFRRPVDAAIVDDYVAFYREARRDMTPLEAFRFTAKAMMLSPHFLYHVEVGDTPDDFAIANRLSYFLWRSAPDARLHELAAAGRLGKPDVLRDQVDRMLADDKAQRLLDDFANQWLGIDLVGDIKPDANLYPEYNEDLQRAMIGETRAFLREMLDKDLPLSNLIDSDWAMLNNRIAEHYGIAGVEGIHFRRVKLDKDVTVRGGLLTQASVLNVTSNGTVTSPVIRGVWVLEHLLGTPPPPPPPDVPALEPDIRGATTIKEQLAKHRTIDQCASCHRKIDPFGMALENFDVIGGWRESYRALEATKNPNRPKLVDGHAVVVADSISRLGAYEDFRTFRQLLTQREELVYKNLSRTLATYALGRSMGFADEPAIEQVAADTRRAGGGFKTMIRGLVAGELFRRP